MNQNGKRNNYKLVILLLLLITVIALCITIWVLFFREPDVILTPDYAPQQEEQNAEEIPGDDDEKMESPQGGGSVSLNFTKEVTIALGEKTVNLYAANPSKSNQDIVVQVVIQDKVIVQSGTIKPGNQVTTLELLKGADKQLSTGGYEGKMVFLMYHPDSGEKAIVNSEVPVTINVTE